MAQNTFIGVRWDTSVLLNNNTQSEGSPIGFALAYNQKIIDRLSVEFSTGLVYFKDKSFNGFDFILNCKYSVNKNKRLFLVGGFVIHDNVSSASNSGSTKDDTFYLINFGLGYKLTKVVNFQVTYMHVVGERHYGTIGKWPTFQKLELTGMLRFGLGFYFGI